MIDPNLSRLNVLVVDENRFMRTLIKGVFHAFGIRNVREVGDSADALKELKVFSADLITTELSMQPLDGLELVKLIRAGQDSPNRTVPILAVTAYTERHMVERARDAGVDEFLAKPITAEAMQARLAALFYNRRPFVQTKTYFGPDRRRQRARNANFKGDDRRAGQDGLLPPPPSPLLEMEEDAYRRTASAKKYY